MVDPGDSGVVSYELTIPGGPSGVGDRVVQGRVICRQGAMVLASCSTSLTRRATVGALCQKMLAEITVEPLPPTKLPTSASATETP